MSRILHFSDLHFGTENTDVTQALLHLTEQQQPDLYLLSGDITQRARRSQFAAARTFIQRLPAAPLLAVPGNHDLPLFNLPLRMLDPYGNYRHVFGNELEPEFERDDLLVIGVNSTRPRRHKDGEVSDEQIRRVAQRLKQARPGQLRVVMLHHPVRAVEESDVSNLLIGRERAIPAWVDAGADLLLAGHIHLPYLVPLTGSSERSAWAIQAGTGISQRVRGNIPNSINLIEYEAEGGQPLCHVTRWDYAHEAKGFVAGKTTPLPLGRAD